MKDSYGIRIMDPNNAHSPVVFLPVGATTKTDPNLLSLEIQLKENFPKFEISIVNQADMKEETSLLLEGEKILGYPIFLEVLPPDFSHQLEQE